MKPESGPMEGDYLWREFLMYWHELTFGAFKLIKINQESGEKNPRPRARPPRNHAPPIHRRACHSLRTVHRVKKIEQSSARNRQGRLKTCKR